MPPAGFEPVIPAGAATDLRLRARGHQDWEKKYIEWLYFRILYYKRIYIISEWGNNLYFFALITGETRTRILGNVANMAE